ncbi:MAG: ParB N-terminal domain-containing protein [Terricaulis sp.]
MSEFARRGLGRGLSALLGEPVKADFGTPAPTPANAPAWIPPEPPVSAAPPQSLIDPPRNVFELPTAAAPPVVQPEPIVEEASAPQATTDAGPRGLPIELVQRNPGQPRKHFDESELTDLANSIRNHGVLQRAAADPGAPDCGRPLRDRRR